MRSAFLAPTLLPIPQNTSPADGSSRESGSWGPLALATLSPTYPMIWHNCSVTWSLCVFPLSGLW